MPLPNRVQTPPWSQYMPDAMNVLDGIADLSSEFLLIKLHLRWTDRRLVRASPATGGRDRPTLLPGTTETYLNQLKRKAFMEDPVNAGSTGQFISVDLVSRTFDALLEVNCKLLDHPVWERGVA